MSTCGRHRPPRGPVPLIHVAPRLIAQCTKFLMQRNIVQPSKFFSDESHQYTPQFIVVWIMNESVHAFLSNKLCPHQTNYSTVQKMHTLMTYTFGCIHGLGSMHWQRSADRCMVGNPSVSEVVSRYMLSLHRRKVKAGETTTSVRAISMATLCKLYHFNSRLQLTLPFQKMSQFGHIKLFVLHKLPDLMAHLCPVWAYAEWINTLQISDGYVFRRLGSRD
ncbi:hypothetical protein EDB85DRAFT_1869124 [Lactarius pseudohatsudake]|nr:hypothetical protein EDB85DRAFT_1869124 [Lactarius pseudohatsudake]